MTLPSPPHLVLWQKATDLARALQAAGFEARFAGGCVRDRLLGLAPHDIDIATSATPEQVLSVFPAGKSIGRAFGVILVPLDDGEAIEIATYRKESDYRDGRHPESVVFTNDREDAARRDFTVNGMFFDPITETLYDYVGGQSDLTQKIIRAIGDPSERFHEDGLRMLRAVRFSATLDFTIDPGTLAAIREHAPSIHRISIERIQHELTRMLCEAPRRAGQAIVTLRDSGLLDQILPEVSALQGVEQPPEFHPEGDVFTHTVMMLNGLVDPPPALAYAVLLHDIAKPATATIGPDRRGGTRIRFDGHAELGATMTQNILTRLRLPRRDIEDAARIVARHMHFINVPQMKTSTLRRLLGEPTFPLELELHRLDCLASHGGLETYQTLMDARDQLAAEPVLPPRWLTGRDLLDLGLPSGPAIGRWLQKAYDAQLEGRFTDRDALLAWIKNEIESSAE